jgi:hypothetical protein
MVFNYAEILWGIRQSALWPPMILDVRFGFGRRADAELLGNEPVFFIKGTGVDVDLQGVKPDVLRREGLGMSQERRTDPVPPVVRVDIEVIHEIIPDRYECHRKSCGLGYPDSILWKYEILKIAAIFNEGMALEVLKFGQRNLAGEAP